MKSLHAALASLFLLSACGQQTEENSSLSSERFAISVLGIEMGSCTQDELRRFVAGERVPAISDKLSKDQQMELRQKFARPIRVPAVRAQEAIESPAGIEVRSLLNAIFPTNYKDEHIVSAFTQSVANNEFTLLEFVSLYPTPELRVNGLAFVSKKDKLEAALIKLEQEFNY